MIFIYCYWVSTRWQWLVDLHKNRKETAQEEKQYTKQYRNNKKHRIHKIENKNTKQKTNVKRIFTKHKSSNLENDENEQVIMTQRTAQKLHTASEL
jgi:hypothetical protein